VGDKQSRGSSQAQESTISVEADQEVSKPVALPKAGPEELSAKAESSSILEKSG
jgi:hypothetical protein